MKSPIPETRNSLILRLPDKRDVEAWDQFVSIYEPLVYRLARAKGFQDADARDVTQEVLVAVLRGGAVGRFAPSEQWETDDYGWPKRPFSGFFRFLIGLHEVYCMTTKLAFAFVTTVLTLSLTLGVLAQDEHKQIGVNEFEE